MTCFSGPALTAALVTVLVPIAAAGQPKGEVEHFSDVTVEGSVLERPSLVRPISLVWLSRTQCKIL